MPFSLQSDGAFLALDAPPYQETITVSMSAYGTIAICHAVCPFDPPVFSPARGENLMWPANVYLHEDHYNIFIYYRYILIKFYIKFACVRRHRLLDGMVILARRRGHSR
jgi:hypothetical protein